MAAARGFAKIENASNAEVQLVGMEARLRSLITDLTNPISARVATLGTDIETMKHRVDHQTRTLEDVRLGMLRNMEQISGIGELRDEISRSDETARLHESNVDANITRMQDKVEGFTRALELKEIAVDQLRRCNDRAAMDTKRLQEDFESLQRQVIDNSASHSKALNQAQADLEVRIVGVEIKHNTLTDELWSEETGLLNVAGQLQKTHSQVEELASVLDTVRAEKAEQTDLEKLRVEVGKMLENAASLVDSLKTDVAGVVNDVREQFQTASDMIAKHNASMVNQVRHEYQEEIASSVRTRDEVKVFMGKIDDSIEGIAAQVDKSSQRTDSIAVELRDEMEEINKKRKRDLASTEKELKSFRNRLGGVFDNSDAVLGGLEHFNFVLQLLVDSDLMQTSLELQEVLDRKRIALMGVKEDETMLVRSNQTEPQKPRPEVRSRSACSEKRPISQLTNVTATTAATEASMSSRYGQEAVVRVDNRCLSCSGQSPLVLTAFKMACLQYTPSPVEHDGRRYDRSSLVEERQRLLMRARQAMMQGPSSGFSSAKASPEVGSDARETVLFTPSSEDDPAVMVADQSQRFPRDEIFAEYAMIESGPYAKPPVVVAERPPAPSQRKKRLPNLPERAASAMGRPITAR